MDTQSVPSMQARAFALGALLGASVIIYAPNSRAADSAIATQILDEIATADRVRSVQATAEEDWERERGNLDALESGLRTALKQLKEAGAQHEKELADVRRDLERMEDEAPPCEQAEKLLGQVVGDAESELAALGRDLIPGIIPPPQTGPEHPPNERLLDLVLRLQQSDRAVSSWDSAIFDGRLEGKAVVVQVLRCGAVAAWWRSLEGDRNGIAVWKDAALQLTAARNPAEARGIAEAFAVFEGRRVPEIVDLPFGHARQED